MSTDVSLYTYSELVLITASLLICQLFESVTAIATDYKSEVSNNYLNLVHMSALLTKLVESFCELGAGHVEG